METRQPVEALVGLGASLGPCARALRLAAWALHGDGVQMLAASRLYWSPPAGGVARRPFLNAVVRVRTVLPPEGLLERLRRIEARLGRQASRRWADRVVDVDLIQYGTLVMETPALVLPHPRARGRSFVVQPLFEVAPDAVDPRDGTRWADAPARWPPLPLRGGLPRRWRPTVAGGARTV